jgi:two-component system response regulator
MRTSSMGHTVLLITGDYHGCVPLARAFLRAAPHVNLSSVKGATQWREYLSGVRAYADRDAHPTRGIILLDLDMEPAEALNVLEWLKDKPDSRHIPVVILTAFHESHVIEQAYALGANSCLLKSVDDQVSYDQAMGIGTYAALVTNVAGGGPVSPLEAS